MPARPRRRLAALATALLVALLPLTACGLAGDDGGDRQTLTVWLMRDSLGDELTEDVVSDFERRNPDTEAEITVQDWDGIGEKVSAALESDEAPDVVEVGNTQVARYVDGGGVRNLTLKVADLGGDDWIPGLEEPGKIDGYQYGIPYYAANRVVIYRKDLFEQAGIDGTPRTREEWLAATRRLDQPGTGQQGIYLPGQNWYVLAGFIRDEGGDLALEQSGRWHGRPRSSLAARSPSSSPYPDRRSRSPRPAPNSPDSWATSPFRARRRANQAPSSRTAQC